LLWLALAIRVTAGNNPGIAQDASTASWIIALGQVMAFNKRERCMISPAATEILMYLPIFSKASRKVMSGINISISALTPC